jgi:hypothetical protein
MSRINKLPKLLFLMIVVSISSYSQIKDTLCTNNLNLGICIGPIFEVSRINKTRAEFLGFKISLTNHRDEIGLSLQKLNSTILYDISSDFHLKYNIFSGDIFYKKYFKMNNDLYLSLGLTLGSAFLKLKDSEYPSYNFQKGYYNGVFVSDTYFFVKPQIGMNYNILNKFFFGIDGGYKAIIGLNANNRSDPSVMYFSNKDFSCFYINFSLEYIYIIK